MSVEIVAVLSELHKIVLFAVHRVGDACLEETELHRVSWNLLPRAHDEIHDQLVARLLTVAARRAGLRAPLAACSSVAQVVGTNPLHPSGL